MEFVLLKYKLIIPMKQFVRTLILTLVFTAFLTVKASSQTVYVQENGKKYHMKNCAVAGTGKKGMTIAEAKKAGYTACAKCKPDENTKAEEKKTQPADKPKTPADKPKTGK